MTKRPTVLYKYRHFNDKTIDLLCADRVYYADPSTFNDPLDTKPCVETDCEVALLEQTVREMVRRRVYAQMRAGAVAVKYRGQKTLAHIEKHSDHEAQRRIEALQYQATDPEYSDDVTDTYALVLKHAIEEELLRQYNKGILSLAGRHDCPLMWSHYGDQHHGICIGYTVPPDTPEWVLQLHPVDYDRGDRNVRSSAVAAMVLKDDARARAEVDAAVLLRKAPDWRYEQEWRLFGQRGLSDSPLELAEIVFGMRCPSTVKHTVASALKGRDKEVKLYEMHERRGTFQLDRNELDVGELSVYYPRRALSDMEGFDPCVEEGDPPQVSSSA